MKSDSVIHACTVVTLLDPMFMVYTAMIRATSFVCYLYQKHTSKTYKQHPKNISKNLCGTFSKIKLHYLYTYIFKFYTNILSFFEIIY